MQLYLEDGTSGARHVLFPRDGDGTQPLWIQENGTYHIVYVGDPTAGKPILAISGILARMADWEPGAEVVVKWEWKPGYYAGRLPLTLAVGGQTVLAETMIIHPQQLKLTQDQFDQMLAEILAVAETCFALSPVSQQVSLTEERQDRPLANLEFVRRHFRQLTGLVELLLQSPNKQLQRTSRLLPADEAAPDDTSTDWVATEGVGYLRPASTGRGLPGRGHGFTLTDLRVYPTVISHDTFENRFVRQFLIELRRRLFKARSTIEAAKTEMENQEGHVLRRTRIAELSVYIHKLTTWLDAPLFKGVGDFLPTQQGNHVLHKHPLYAQIYRIWTKFRRGARAFDGALLELPLEQTWQLYEYWAFMMVVRALEEHLTDASDLFRVEESSSKVALALVRDEKSVLLLKGGHRLYFQRRYARTGFGLGAATVAMEPDIVLEICHEDSESVILLDPKYRATASSLGAALKDIHAYRDGIRRFPGGERVVSLGIILAPSEVGDVFQPGFGDKTGVEGIRLVPGDHESFLALQKRLLGLLA